MTDEEFEIGKKILANRCSISDFRVGELKSYDKHIDYVKGKLRGDMVFLLKIEENMLLSWDLYQLMYVYEMKDTARICRDTKGDIHIGNHQDLKEDYVLVDCDTTISFLDLEPQLIEQYGLGQWVVYCEQSLTIHQTLGSATKYANALPGGKLVCCLGYKMKQL